MAELTHPEIHADHRFWTGENALWREEVGVWRATDVVGGYAAWRAAPLAP